MTKMWKPAAQIESEQLSHNLRVMRERWSDVIAIRPSRFPDLAYCCVQPGDWRILDVRGYIEEVGGLPSIGPIYKSKSELLEDLKRFRAEVYAYTPSEVVHGHEIHDKDVW